MGNHFEITTESTMIGPLYARAYFGEKYPEILSDSGAIDLIKKIKMLHPEAKREFSAMESLVNEFLGLTLIIRARVLDDAIRGFTKTRPNATVVNLGCGLDTSFSRVDNGEMLWFDLDLPDAIEYRLKLIDETSRSKCIAKSIFDTSWFQEVDYTHDNGIIFIAGGLFGYFEENQVANLIASLAEQFQGGELIFDIQSRLGNAVVNRQIERTGASGVKFKLAIGNPEKQISRWSEKIEVVDWFPMFSRIKRNPHWSRKTKLMMSVTDMYAAGKFIHLRFQH